MISSSMKTTMDVKRQTRTFYARANLLQQRAVCASCGPAIMLFCADFFVFHYRTVLVKGLYLEEFPRLMNCCTNQFIILLIE